MGKSILGALLNAIPRVYRWLLCACPRRFRATFREEMVAVFSTELQDAACSGARAVAGVILREMTSLPRVYYRIYLAQAGLLIHSLRNLPATWRWLPAEDAPDPDGRDSWRMAALELIPLLIVCGCMVVVTYLPPGWLDAGWQRGTSAFLPILYALPAAWLLLGLARGLPRWAYPPAGMLVSCTVLAAAWSRVAPYALLFALGGVVLAIYGLRDVGMGATALPVVQRWGRSLAMDGSRVAFGLYGALPLAVMLAFDDAFDNARAPWFGASFLLIVVSGLAYSRARKPAAQMAALLGGACAAFSCALLDLAGNTVLPGSASATWAAGLPWLLMLWVGMLLVLIAPFGVMLPSQMHRRKGGRHDPSGWA